MTVKNRSLARRLTRKFLKRPKSKSRRRKSSAPHPAAAEDWFDVGRVTIDKLPENALQLIFGFYVDEAASINGWHTLVHVCRKWRNVVFQSSRRLNLQLRCTSWLPVGRTLNIWPALPIVVQSSGHLTWGVANIIAALEHNQRVCRITLTPIPGLQPRRVLAAMNEPFPALTHLRLKSEDGTPPVAPNSFLGGSAPRLRFLELDRIPFPGLPKLLLSTTDLVDLRLWEIPHSGYISPETMVTCLSTLTRLEKLDLEFESPQSRPVQKDPRPLRSKRSVLPALTRFWFRGASEYLEDLVAGIDAPLLHSFFIGFFYQLNFDTPQLAQFISRTQTLKLHNQPQLMCFSDWGASVTFLREGTSDRVLQLGILCRQSDWQLSSLAQVCASSFPYPLISTVKHLSILEETRSPLHWQDDIRNSEWLELLHPFTSVKNLYLSKELSPRIAPSLRELVGRRASEALPTLQNLFLEELHSPLARPVEEAIGRFVAARQLSNHPVAISQWERDGYVWNDD